MKWLEYRHSYLNQKMAKFIGVGVINTFFGYGIYAVLIVMNAPYLTALFIATVAGVTFNFFSTGRLVFQSSGGLIVLGKFIAAYGAVYVINVLLLEFAISYLKVNPYLGQALCFPPNVIFSWTLMNYWVFNKR